MYAVTVNGQVWIENLTWEQAETVCECAVSEGEVSANDVLEIVPDQSETAV